MKSFLLLLLLAGSLKAVDVQLAWDANPPADNVVSYTLYAHTNTLTQANLASAVVKQSVGTNLTAKVEGLVGSWWFTVTARSASGLESEISNVVTGTWAAPVRAMTPTNMRFAGLGAGPWTGQLLTKYFRLRW